MNAASTSESRGAARRRAPGRNLSRPQSIAETLKDWIMDQGMRPGDRLPQEAQLISILGASKGTVREALRVLETQGLIRTRTGPGGGAFITEVRPDHAALLLANLFYFEPPSLEDLLAMREALLPMLAGELALRLEPAAVEALAAHAPAPLPAEAPATAARRAADLDFDEELARRSANPLLRFFCGFLARMMHELVETGPAASAAPAAAWPRDGAAALIEALRARDAEGAKAAASRRMAQEHAALAASGFAVARRFLPARGRR